MSNTLVIDSGSSKTKWVTISDGEVIKEVKTQGFNPYFYSAETLKLILLKEVIPVLGNIPIHNIYYYGTGCSSNQSKSVVHDGLQQVFRASNIFIEHDLLGTAIALLKEEQGIACILGTGMNSCVYDGSKITHNIPSLGYLLADEGSGTDLGRRLLAAYLKHELPEELASAFKSLVGLNDANLLKQVYSEEKPNQFLSSFTYFLKEHLSNSFIKALVMESFEDFIKTYLIKYPNYQKLPVRFIGSIAYEFQDVLKEAAVPYGLNIDLILKEPMDGLIEFHQKA